MTEMEAQSEQAKQQIIQAMNRLGDVRSQRARLSAMKSALENQLGNMEADHDREQTGVAALGEHVQAAQDLLDEENARKAELNRQVEDMQARVQALSEGSTDLNQRLARLQTERQQRDSRLKLLREMQRDYEGYNNSVKQVLLQARRQQGGGVHGVVADLIHVPARLERAVDMVLGGALQNIVVDRDEDAKRMIDYLRANRFGRATFLPISSVRGRTLTSQERNVLSMPGCVGVASELVDFDSQYQGVIDNLLGCTVVAENLNAGIAIQRAGRYQFRLVTLEGDVMHSGGSMTGGSVQSRMTSLLSRTREIEESEAALKKIEAEFAALQEKYTAIEQERAGLKRERGELYDALHSQEIVCARAETQLKAALDEQNSNNQRIARLESERERLQTQLEDVSGSLVALDGQQQSAETSTDDRQAEVKQLSEKIYQMRSATDALRTVVGDERVSLASRRRGLEAAIADRDRLSAQAENTERLLAESEGQLIKCQSELSENAVLLERDIAALSENKELLDAARTAFNEADARRTGVQKQLQVLAEQSDGLRANLDDFSDRHHRSELQLARVEGEFKQIQDRIWEDYELTLAQRRTLPSA